MQKTIIFSFFLYVAMVPVVLFGNENIIVKSGMKNGVLEDLTPPSISGDQVKINPNGPFFIIVGITKNPDELRRIDDGNNEKLKFNVKEGAGKFVLMSDVAKKGRAKLEVPTSGRNKVLVMFYPSKKKASKNIISAELERDGKVLGQLEYSLKSEELSAGSLNDAWKMNFENEKKCKQKKLDFRIIRTVEDFQEKSKKNSLTTNVTYSENVGDENIFHETNKNGKILYRVNIEKAIKNLEKNYLSKKGTAWGRDENSIITLSGSNGADAVYVFSFYDAKNGLIIKSVCLTLYTVLFADNKYIAKDDCYMLQEALEVQCGLGGKPFSKRTEKKEIIEK
jgi:hypothetical protein